MRWSGSSDDDLRTLGYGLWLAALEAGIAPHHAGLVPAFRQAVEQCFSEGLLKLVFATETLALGINMPARTVVIERFAKFRGSGHLGPDLGGVPAADRAGRPPGHRHGRPRRGPVVAGHLLRHGGGHRHRPAPDLRSSFHPDLQPGREPGPAVDAGRRPTRCWPSSYGQWQAPRAPSPSPPSWTAAWPSWSARGYVEGWRLTAAGPLLAGIYHESDLLVAEALGRGSSTGWTPPPWPGWSPP